MKLGYMDAMLKQMFSHHSWQLKVLQLKKNKYSELLKSCWQIFNSKGVVHHEFLPKGFTVNKDYFLEIMEFLQEAIRRKRASAWRSNCWMLYADKALMLSLLLLIRQFLAKDETRVIHISLLVWSSTGDFFLFTKLKIIWKGQCFQLIDSIKEDSLLELHSVPNEKFQKCFQGWKKH